VFLYLLSYAHDCSILCRIFPSPGPEWQKSKNPIFQGQTILGPYISILKFVKPYPSVDDVVKGMQNKDDQFVSSVVAGT
jgi:hypothetical protein